MTLAPGTRLGRYEVRSPLGAGGMGEVYLARDTSELGREVAVKVLPTEMAADPERMRRFLQEAKTASSLNHPNIITIHEVGQEDGTRYLVTEYVEGKTLRRRMTGERLTLREALDVATQIASALVAAHKAGVVHRDIKPENVMVRGDGIVKVLDFGLAKPTGRPVETDTEAPTRALVNTSPGMVMGTVSYMSPEQARGLAVDERTDIWSLGVVLYEMVAGRVPFAGDTASDVIAHVLTKEPAALAVASEKVSERLDEIAQKALAKDREERYQHVKDMLIDLKRLRQKLDVEAEIERTHTPEEVAAAAATGGAARAAQPTGDGHSAVATDRLAAAQTGGGVHTTSSAEYVVTEIKRHKRGALAALAALLVMTVAVGYFAYSRYSPGGDGIRSIAVLPFANGGGEPEAEYLSDGISESLINSLTQVQQLRVTARSTAFRYKGREADPLRVGRELNVQAVLTGRVRQAGDRLNVQVDLVDVATGAQLWGEQYERKFSDVITVKQAIAREVTERLRLRLTGEQQRQLVRRDTANPEAYQSYLRGRFYWNKREEKEFRKAVEHFNQAIALDPNYAAAYAGLADAFALLSSFSFMPPTEAIPKARESARRALSLDDSLAEPHATLGYVSAQYDHDFAGAERELKRAIELNPNYGTAHQWYGEVLTYVGKFDEAYDEFRRGLEVEPLSLPINWDFGRCLYMGRRYDESLAQHKRAIELDPGFARAHLTLGDLYRVRKDYANALEEHARFYELRGEPQNATLARESFARGGWSEYLRLVTAGNSPLKPTYWMTARAYVELGEKDKAFAELDKAYENRASGLSWLKVEPLLDPLRSDPRFAELLRKVGLPQ